MNELAVIFKQIMDFLYGFTGDYGVAIVVLTILFRTLLLPLNIKQKKSMKKQQELQLKVEELKKRHKNNEKKLNEELQKLMAAEGTGSMGCLLSFLQLPLMACLYQAIRLTIAAGTATVLLPWVGSLLVRDRTLILPILTVIVQLLPQTFPYLKFFKGLKLQKSGLPMILSMAAFTGVIGVSLPSGVGLYYLASNVYSFCEQLAGHLLAVRRLRAAA